jgi:tetratricopeptide (TPR) repeat protein
MKKTAMIENYLSGTMSDAEREEFIKKMSEEPKLAEEVNMYHEVNAAIVENDVHYFRETVKSILRRKSATSSKLHLSWAKYPIVAGIIVLVGISLWQIVFTKTPPELYAGYYQPYHSDISVRSAGRETDKIQISYRLYQQGDYEASYEILRNYLENNLNDQTARFYFGMNAMELGLNEIAIQELSQIEDDPSTPFSLHARWYLALIYLKADHPEKATNYLVSISNGENMYSARARELLRRL